MADANKYSQPRFSRRCIVAICLILGSSHSISQRTLTCRSEVWEYSYTKKRDRSVQKKTGLHQPRVGWALRRPHYTINKRVAKQQAFASVEYLSDADPYIPGPGKGLIVNKRNMLSLSRRISGPVLFSILAECQKIF